MHLHKSFPIFSLSIFSLIPFGSYANENKEILNFFNEFEKNPSKMMNKIPEKKIVEGDNKIFNRFTKYDIENKNYLTQKDLFREELIQKTQVNHKPIKAEYLSNDNPQELLDDPSTFVDDLNQIDSDARDLKFSKLPFQPWSSSYWPSYLGSIAFRYSDSNLEDVNDLNSIRNYLMYVRSAASLIRENKTDELSPAEKYDLLMNDSSFSLTNSTLNYLNEKNMRNPIERWEGICHGWAIAAYLYNRPVRTVTVYNSSGVKINFYPADIKALTSLIWAEIPSRSKFVGGRCNDKDPATDQNGRIISQDCFDSNPGTVHLALINQVGINHKSFVFDASYDYEVWNQPVLSYSYKYFNLNTKNVAQTSAKAKIPLRFYSSDPFRAYRSSKTVDVVGVQMTLNYIVETYPTSAKTDSPNRDGVRSVVYYYDLELDASGKVIGGEWYQNTHPDFLWTPSSNADVTLNAIPYNPGNSWSYNYANYIWVDSPRSPEPQWTTYAKYYSIQKRLPLDHVVKNLNAWASVDKNETPENCTQPCVPMTYDWHK